MGMFDDVFVNAKSAANAVGKKAGKLVDLSKLRISAADLNGEISKKFQSLGREVYSAKKAGTDPSAAIESASAEISELMEQLDAVNAQLAAAHAKIICGYCGQENSQDAVYCCKCGHRLCEEKKTEPEACCAEATAEPAEEKTPEDDSCCCKDDSCCETEKKD